MRLARVVLVCTLLAGAASAQEVVPPASPAATEIEREKFNEFVTQLRAAAVTRGISAATIEQALTDLEPLPVVIERDRSQPEAMLSIDRYVQRRLTKSFVAAARQMRRTHRELLDKVSSRYGLPVDYIVAIWGLESNFGRFTGVRPVVQTLATLAFEGRRAAFFTD